MDDQAAVGTYDLAELDGSALVSSAAGDLSLVLDVPVEISVEIGRARMTIGEAMSLAQGSVVALERMAGEPVDLLVNGRPVARGEVIAIDEQFGLRVTEVLPPHPRQAQR
jgi:flagellar motor switch protein FliN/FliY